jgi:LysM repeat protein
MYTVQINDTLSGIADRYGTYPDDLALANCLSNANLIVVGQQLRVPGDTPPANVVECTPWEVLTPFNGTMGVPTTGQITFNWRGPRAHRNLIRVHRPDGSKFESVVELRQNDTVDIAANFRLGGTYTWYVYPLDEYFRQIPCKEGGPWTFTKPETPTEALNSN